VRFSPKVAALLAVVFAHSANAQDTSLDLTPAGKAIMQRKIAAADQSISRPGSAQSMTFPVATCTFPGGLCGAVRRDGTVAVPPRYDWVGRFSDHRAAVRIGGLYGFVDEEGQEVVKPQYRIVDDYKFGFAQVDVNGKSGLIDRDGKMVFEPKYGFIAAIGPDRFRVSDLRRLGGTIGSENFSGYRTQFSASGGVVVSGPILDFRPDVSGVISISGEWIDRPGALEPPAFDKDDRSVSWRQRDKLWGLARADGSWLVEPKFQRPASLKDGMAQVMVNGKVGFIDRAGNFTTEPVFDKVWSFEPGLARTSAERDGIVGVIDKAGVWVFQTNYQQVYLAIARGRDRKSDSVFGWHFKKAERWGLLDLDGRVLLDADFDQQVQHCADGRLVAFKNKEWFYFKSDGSPLQPPDGRLVDASCGSSPPYTLRIGDKFGLVDAQSKPLTPMRFDSVAWAGTGVKNVKLEGKWGRIGSDGGWILEPKFDYLSAGLDVFAASIDGKRGFMRPDGSWLVEPRFDAARLRGGDTAFVTVAGATGVLRLTDQAWVVQPRPGVMCDIPNAIMSQTDGHRAILSQSGETWIDLSAERIGIRLEDGLAPFLRNGRWGLVDTGGQVIGEPRFDDPVFFTPILRGIAWAKRDGRWCAIDRRGRSVPGIACVEANPLGEWTFRFECKVEP